MADHAQHLEDGNARLTRLRLPSMTSNRSNHG